MLAFAMHQVAAPEHVAHCLMQAFSVSLMRKVEVATQQQSEQLQRWVNKVER
jgi:hypothetical protein